MSEKRLTAIMNDIMMIYTDTQKTLHISKKMENYQKCCILVKEAKNLINKLEKEIEELDTIKDIDTNFEKMKELTILLDLPHLKCSELMNIISKIKAIYNGLPTESHIMSGLENDIIYEEHEVKMEK